MATSELTPRSPGWLVRSFSRGVQARLDRCAARFTPRSLMGRATRAIARTWVTAWWIAVTAVAASVAWAATSLTGIANPVPGAVAAVLTVALSANRSLKTGVSLVVATAAALMIAFGLYQVWGIHVWTAGVLVAVSLVIGRAMRLGVDGALQIPATALFVYVLGDGLTDDVIIHRIAATLLGVVVGLVFSFIAHPETPDQRITERLSELNTRLAGVLTDIGMHSAKGCTRRQAAQWLTECRTLAVDVRRLGETLDDLALGSRVTVASSRAHRSKNQAIRDQYTVLQQTTGQVNDIARGLFDATSRGDVLVPEGISAMLASTGAALTVHASSLATSIEQGGDPPTGVIHALDAVVADRSRSVQDLKNMDDTGALLLGGAIVTEVDRLLDELRRSGDGASAQ
jgi:uncharacterized membrane protein YgaE (UPF0421/DUF939 family)